MNYTDVPDSIRERAMACKSPEELLSLAKEEGYELSDEDLDAVSGGEDWGAAELNCGSHCNHNCVGLKR